MYSNFNTHTVAVALVLGAVVVTVAVSGWLGLPFLIAAVAVESSAET